MKGGKQKMNDAQIKKLMRKVAKPFEEKRKKEKEKIEKKKQQQLKLLIEIRNEIKDIESKNKDHGSCVCISSNKVYAVKKNKTIVVHFLIEEIKKTFKQFKTCSSGTYYMMTKENYIESKRFSDWLIDNYATIKMATHTINNKSHSKDSLVKALQLGGIVKDFQKQFPKNTMIDLITGIKHIDSMITEI